MKKRTSYDPEGQLMDTITVYFHIEMSEVARTTLVLAAIKWAIDWPAEELDA